MKLKNRKGFTLVELIATIALLAIVSSVSFVSINGILEKRKTDECQMLVNNIKSAAKDYISDNRYGSLVSSASDMKVNFNVSLLTNGEYLNGDMVDPYTSEALDLDKMEIHASLNNDYTVDWIDVVYEDSLYDCGNTIVAENDEDAPVIMVNINNGTTYSKSKGAVITLQDNGVGLRAGTYQLKYGWGTSQPSCSSLSNSVSLTVSDNAYEASESVTVSGYTGNGRLYVCNASNIKDVLGNTLTANTMINKDLYLDNSGPIVTINNDNVSITDDGLLVPISISDSHSGFDKDSFVLSDLIVKKGSTTLSSGYTLTNTAGNDYNLIISDYKNTSNIEVNIGASKILDKLGNGNTNSTLSVDMSKFTYTIKYMGNGATSGSMSDTSCIYGSDCSVRSNSYVRDGYTFNGWTTKSDGTDDGYGWTGWNNEWTYENGDRGISNYTLTLYARWKRNTVTIKYNVNGGTITSSTGSNTWSTIDSLIYKNGSLLTTKINYDNEIGTDGLANYNNSSYVEIKKSGKTGVDGAEWKCLSGCTTSGKTFDHDIETYKSSDFCNAKTASCEVTLGVNWETMTYAVTYNANGGSGAPSTQTKTHGTNITFSTTKPTRDGYTFSKWNTEADGSGTDYASGATYSVNASVILYAQWIRNTVTIKYSVNGGTITSSTGSNTWTTTSDLIYKNGTLVTTKIYYDEEIGGSGLANYNNSNYIEITKSNKAGSPGAEWKCLSGCTTSGKTFNQVTETYKSSDFCNAKTSSCEVTIGVNWINAYTITYNANGGSGAPDSHFGAIGGNVTLSSTIPTRTVDNACNSHKNYIFLGWSTSSSATSASYYAGGTYSQDNNNNVTLYAVWELDSVRFKVEDKKVQVFQLPSCNASGVCNYDRINDVETSGTINKSDTYTKNGVKALYIAKTLYMANQTTSCYCSPSTASTRKNAFPWCEDWMNDNNGDMDPNYITVWDTNVTDWYYSRTYDCFIQKSNLVSSIKTANASACPSE